MTLRDAPGNLARLWWRHGSAAAFRRLWSVLRPHHETLVLFGLERARAERQAESAKVRHRLATRAEVTRLPPELLRPHLLALFDRGDRCLLQEVDGRLIGLVWASTAAVVELAPGVRLRVPPDVVYTYRSWTHPEFRGAGLQAQRHLSVLEEVRKEGRKRLFCFVRDTNFDSLKGVQKSGCSRIGTVRIRAGRQPPSWMLEISDPDWTGLERAE